MPGDLQHHRVVGGCTVGVGGPHCVSVHGGPPEGRHVDLADHGGAQHPADALGDSHRLGRLGNHPPQGGGQRRLHRGAPTEPAHAHVVGAAGHRDEEIEAFSRLHPGAFELCREYLGGLPEHHEVAVQLPLIVEEANAGVRVGRHQGP